MTLDLSTATVTEAAGTTRNQGEFVCLSVNWWRVSKVRCLRQPFSNLKKYKVTCELDTGTVREVSFVTHSPRASVRLHQAGPLGSLTPLHLFRSESPLHAS